MKKWQIFFLIEISAVMIALVMPITPSKTGSDWSFAHLVFFHPTYLQKVLVNFVAVNLIIAVLALVFVVWVKLDKDREA